MENEKESKNLFKFSKRFYFQALIFVVVAYVHLYITPMFKVEVAYYSDEFLADPIHSIIGIALLLPGEFINYFIFTILETTQTELVSSIVYGIMGAFLISEKVYLRFISVILVGFFTWYAYVTFILVALGD